MKIKNVVIFIVFIISVSVIGIANAEWVDADGEGQESINISNNSGKSINASMFVDLSNNPHIIWGDYRNGSSKIY